MPQVVAGVTMTKLLSVCLIDYLLNGTLVSTSLLSVLYVCSIIASCGTVYLLKTSRPLS
jgi:hypothetical protein